MKQGLVILSALVATSHAEAKYDVYDVVNQAELEKHTQAVADRLLHSAVKEFKNDTVKKIENASHNMDEIDALVAEFDEELGTSTDIIGDNLKEAGRNFDAVREKIKKDADQLTAFKKRPRTRPCGNKPHGECGDKSHIDIANENMEDAVKHMRDMETDDDRDHVEANISKMEENYKNLAKMAELNDYWRKFMLADQDEMTQNMKHARMHIRNAADYFDEAKDALMDVSNEEQQGRLNKAADAMDDLKIDLQLDVVRQQEHAANDPEALKYGPGGVSAAEVLDGYVIPQDEVANVYNQAYARSWGKKLEADELP